MNATKLTALGLGTALLLGLGVTAQADEEKVLNFGCAMYTDGMVNSALDENSGWNAMRYGIAEALFKFDDNMEVTPWLAESYEVTYPTVRLRLDKLIQKIQAQEQEETAPYVKLIKKLALEDRIDFEAAKILISTYRKEKNEEKK